MLIMESLRHWADLGVDGFRFDLASALARDAHGQVQTDDAALISEITALATSRKLRIVAEAWDLGVNLMGTSFSGWLWGQWNGQYRDDLRAFVRGDADKLGALMRRLYGSDDLFPDGPGKFTGLIRASTSSPRTMVFVYMIWSPTSRNTTRGTDITTRMGRTTTRVGTAAGKAM